MPLSPKKRAILESLLQSQKAGIDLMQKHQNAGKETMQFQEIMNTLHFLTANVREGYDGKTPMKGVDYFTEQEVKEFLQKVTPVKGVHYNDGEKGATPKKGVDYFDGVDGKTPVKGIDYNDGEDGVALPTTTVLSKILNLGFIYNTANSLNKWQLVASSQES